MLSNIPQLFIMQSINLIYFIEKNDLKKIMLLEAPSFVGEQREEEPMLTLHSTSG